VRSTESLALKPETVIVTALVAATDLGDADAAAGADRETGRGAAVINEQSALRDLSADRRRA
jgi:hypothetical protein